MPSYFITGASRGIGLAIAEELLKDKKNFVIASARNPSTSKGLMAIAANFPKEQLVVFQFDVADPESVNCGVIEATALLPHGLDYLIHNAGVNFQPLTPFDEIDYELLAKEVYHRRIANAFLPLIRKSTAKESAIISSQLGSLEISPLFPSLAGAHGTSKAALNMLACKGGATPKQEGITTGILIHPGWVDTDIGNTIDDWVTTYAPELVSAKL